MNMAAWQVHCSQCLLLLGPEYKETSQEVDMPSKFLQSSQNLRQSVLSTEHIFVRQTSAMSEFSFGCSQTTAAACVGRFSPSPFPLHVERCHTLLSPHYESAMCLRWTDNLLAGSSAQSSSGASSPTLALVGPLADFYSVTKCQCWTGPWAGRRKSFSPFSQPAINEGMSYRHSNKQACCDYWRNPLSYSLPVV